MKRQTLLLLVIGLVALIMQGLVHADTLTVRRVRLQASSTTAFPGETVKIAAHTGRVNFVFQNLPGTIPGTGAADIDFAGAIVSIVNIFP